MCGRFTQSSPLDVVLRELAVIDRVAADYAERYNIAPGQTAPAAVSGKTGEVVLAPLRWGLTPRWAREAGPPGKLINARSETLREKPSFRHLLASRRCLVPATGFYEWAARAGGKQPHFIHLPERPVFGMAGLWDTWRGDGGELHTFTILTTEANSAIADIHPRMPVILSVEDGAAWLDRSLAFDAVAERLKPYPAEAMAHYPVSRFVNRPANDGPECIARLPETGELWDAPGEGGP